MSGDIEPLEPRAGDSTQFCTESQGNPYAKKLTFYSLRTFIILFSSANTHSISTESDSRNKAVNKAVNKTNSPIS